MELNEFLDRFGGIYEHSPWIAEAAFNSGNIASVKEIHNEMKSAVDIANKELQLDLIKAHPDLGVAAAEIDKLTASSTSEQTGAGLKECTPEEFEEFQRLNADYKEKFGFPFIIAVKGLDRIDILEAFRARILNEKEDEFKTALEQIHKIAYFRLMELSI
jgi:2-oxo-4-hydroxy-4-carboxy-5-ureidoimidazoline decarboxylase